MAAATVRGDGCPGVGVAHCGSAAGVAAASGVSPGVAGFGTGFTHSACQRYSTRKQRKMAKRTRRSMFTSWSPLASGLRTSSTPAGRECGRNRIEPPAHSGWQRARRRRPASRPEDTVALDGFGRVVGARGQKSARSPEIWGNDRVYRREAPFRATRTDTAVKAVAIIGFKDGQGGVEQLALGHDDDVKPRRDVVATENLSYQSFSSVSLNGSAELFRRRDAQPSYRALVGKDEHGRVAPVDADAAFIDS